MTEDEMNRFIASLSLAAPEPEFNARNLPSPRPYGTIQPDTGAFVGGGGETDVSGEYRNFGISPGFRAGPVSGSAMVAAGRDMPTPGVGYSVNAELPGGFNAGYRRSHAMETPSRYDQHMVSLARQILGNNVSGSMTEQDGRRGFGAGVSRPLGGGGNAFINAQRDPRGGHAIMGGMDMRFSRGGYADGGDAEVQSNGMPVISDGQVNWGDSSNAADFVRADQAMRAMRSAPAAPEPQAAPRLEPRRPAPVYSAPRDVPRDVPSDVPLPPVRPAYLDRPYEPEGPFGALDMSSMQPAPVPSVSMGYRDVSPLFEGSTAKAPSFGAMENITPGAPEWRRGSFPQEGGGKYANRAMPLTPPAQNQPSTEELLAHLSSPQGVAAQQPPAPPEPTTDQLLALLSNPTKSVASAAIDQAAPVAKFTDRAAPGISMTPQQRDLIIRTIAAESSGKTPEEGQGIAHVIMNRIMSGRYGKTPERVLFAPKQFEPWGDPRGSNYPMRHKPGMAKYEKAQAALDAAMDGDDITGGATLFWGPKAQAALGRPAPKWGRTGGLDIGETRFHRDDGGMVEEREGHAGGKAVGTALLAGRKHIPLATPTPKAPRAFELDYPRGAEANASGRLERSIEGAPLNAPYIAGRQTPGGPDVPLSKQDMEAIMAHITGRPVEYGPLNGGLLDAVTVSKGSGRPTGVTISDKLNEAQQQLVVPHAFGHVVDDSAGRIPFTGVRAQADRTYNTLATGRERDRFLESPKAQNYPVEEQPRELSAEMIRAYATDPNYLKTVAPDVAKRIRDYVNPHPELSKIVQFNAVPAAIGAGAMMQGDGEAPVEREAHGGGSRVIGNAANTVVEAALEALRGGRKIFPKPQRMFPEGARPPGGEYLDAATGEAITGQKPARAVIGVTPEGKPIFLADTQQVDVTGSPGPGSTKTKTNLFKQQAGWKWNEAPEGYGDASTLVSAENRGQHYYGLGADFPKGVDLERYANATSEPRLRPTTQGNVYPGQQVGSIDVRGREHPVYDMLTIRNLLAGTGAAGAGAAAMPDEGAAEPIEREPHAGGGEVSEGNDMDSYAARALYLARGGYATPGFVDDQPEEEYPDGARPLTIYRNPNRAAPAGAMDVSGDQGPSYDQMGNITSPGRNADPIVDAAMRAIPPRNKTQSPDDLAQRIRDYERQRAEIDAMPEYYRQMTHGSEAPRAPIEVEGGFIGKRQFGTAPYNNAEAMSKFYQTLYDMKTLPLYAAGSVFPPANALGMAIDTAEGVAAGSPTQVAMGAFGAPAKLMKYAAAPLIAATGMLSPDEAQAAKLPKIPKAAKALEGTKGAVGPVGQPMAAGSPDAVQNAVNFAKTVTTPQRGILSIPDLRQMPRDDAVAIARGQPHLIQDASGQYVGAPRGMKTPEQIQAMRDAFDKDVAAGAEGGDWYDRARVFNREISGDDLYRQRLAANEQALWSAQANPDTNLGFALNARTDYEGGMFKDQYRTGQQARSYEEARRAMDLARSVEAEKGMMGHNKGPSLTDMAVPVSGLSRLGKKTGIYGQHLDPTVPPATTGTNDIWHARAFGFNQPDKPMFSRALTEQEHRFLDYETMLAVDRANAAKLAGRSDWTGAEIQAAPWVAGKGRALAERGNKPIAEGIAEAAKTYPDVAPKYTVSTPVEQIPGASTGLMPNLVNASDAEKAAFSKLAGWKDQAGRDKLWSELGMNTRQTNDALGMYRNSAGNPEFNPVEVGRPMTGYNLNKAGNPIVNEAGAAGFTMGQAARGLVDFQEGTPWNKFITHGAGPDKTSIHINMGRNPTRSELEALDAIANKNGMMMTNTEGGVGFINFKGNQTTTTMGKELRAGLEKEIKAVVPNAEVNRARHQGEYFDLADEGRISKANEGKGLSTKYMFDTLADLRSKAPDFYNRILDSKSISEKARANLDRLIASGGSGQRRDYELMLKIIGEDGLRGLLDRVNKLGYQGLPAIGAAGIGSALLPSSGSKDPSEPGRYD